MYHMLELVTWSTGPHVAHVGTGVPEYWSTCWNWCGV